MKKVIQIFKQLQNTSGKKDKEKIILENQDNELFKECLVFLLDDNITTGIAKKKWDSIQIGTTDWIHTDINNELIEMFNYIKTNNTGKDENIIAVKAWCHDFDEESKEFIKGMVTKSIKLGCDKKTVNKVIPNLIFEWKVQLGSPQDKLKLKKDEKFFLSQKCNGIRCTYKDCKLISRQGKEFKGLNHIIEDIKKLVLDDYFIDGELMRNNIDGCDDNLNFRMTTSIVNSDTEDKSEIIFTIFDIFPVETIIGEKTNEKYSVRKQRMKDIEKIIQQTDTKNIRVVEMVYEGSDTSKIDEWLDYAVDKNWEGLMLNKNTPYDFKRTTNLIKIKRFYEVDCPIISVEEGDGRLKGTLGAFVVKYKDNTVNVGSGFSDEQRHQFWAIRELLIDRVITVRYKDVSYDKKTGLESLQFPTFITLREIGKEPNYEG